MLTECLVWEEYLLGALYVQTCAPPAESKEIVQKWIIKGIFNPTEDINTKFARYSE